MISRVWREHYVSVFRHPDNGGSTFLENLKDAFRIQKHN
jgi:hypothetical protein